MTESREQKRNEAAEQMVCFVDGKENPSFWLQTTMCTFTEEKKKKS